MDLCDRQIIGFKMSDNPIAVLVDATIKQVIKTRELPDLTKVINHSDQGSPYKSFKYEKSCQENPLFTKYISEVGKLMG